MSEIQNKPAPPLYLRWIVLLFISLAMCGNYYIYDSIGPLADVLKAQLNFSESDIGFLQAIYSFPNIIMVLIGGIIIDWIGTKKSALLFSIFLLAGASITVARGNIYWMATGRLIFGLGAESMIVAITTVIAQWFKGKQLSFAFGLNLTVARLGSLLAQVSPSWGKSFYNHWQGPLWICVIAALVAFISLGVFYIIDTNSQRKYELGEIGIQDKVVLSEVFSFKRMRVFITSIILFISIIAFNSPIYKISVLLQVFFYILIVVFSFLNYKAFSRSYWFIVLLCITFYSAIFPFQTFANIFFQATQNISREDAGFLIGILTLAAMLITPFFGLLSDYIGKRSLLMMLGSILIIPVYLSMGYKIDIAGAIGLSESFHITIPLFNVSFNFLTNLFIPMVIMGIAFSLVPAIMWPSVSLVTPASKLGTAYGLMTMIQNIGLFGFNIIIGWANDHSHASVANPSGYHLGMWIFSSLGFFGFFFALMLRINEKGSNGYGLEKGMK